MDQLPAAIPADPRAPAHNGGAFDTQDLTRWFHETDGGHGFRMVGENLRHLGIRDGDVLITDGGPLHYGCAAARIFTDFNHENAAVRAAGMIVRQADHKPSLVIGTNVSSVEPEAYSYVTPLVGWIPVRQHEGVVFDEAQLLSRDGDPVEAVPEADPDGYAAFLKEEAEWQASQKLEA